MKYVLDSSVAFKWEVPETDSAKAERLREQYQRGIHVLLAPDVFSVELAHALTRSERQGRIAVGQAEPLWADALTMPPRFARSGLLVGRAIEISSLMRIGVYDCLYVALAEKRRCRFVTADERLIQNLRSRFPFMVSLASMT